MVTFTFTLLEQYNFGCNGRSLTLY